MTESFDRYRETYREVVQDSISFSGLKHDFFLEAKVRVLQRLFHRHFGARPLAVADIGCGVGALHRFLLPLCHRLSACDPSHECIAQAKIENPGVDYESADGQRLPWQDACFDASLAVCVYHHVRQAERAAFVHEMRRIVRPGGLVIVIEHNPWNPGTRLGVARCPFDKDAELLDWRATRLLLEGEGLDVTTEHFLLLPFSGTVTERIERFVRRIPMGAQYLSAGVVPMASDERSA